MGIKRINDLLKKQSPDCFVTIPITSFSGKRVAIDANDWMYTNMATARKKVIRYTDICLKEPDQCEIRKEWFSLAIKFISRWLSYNITPVFVFDGIHPTEKTQTKINRQNQRSTIRSEIDSIYEILKKDKSEWPVGIVDTLAKKLTNYNKISHEDFEIFKSVIKDLGIPCLQAIGDGERLCSALCLDHKVSGVFSVDTDNLAHGCPLLITAFSDQSHLKCVRVDKILSGLNLSQELFLDLCIMSGCDYNTNIPGYGAGKSFNLLKKCGSIDFLPETLDITCLNHIRCRELFKRLPTESLVDGVIILNLNKSSLPNLKGILHIAGVSSMAPSLINLYNMLTQPTDGLIEDLRLSSVKPITLRIIPRVST